MVTKRSVQWSNLQFLAKIIWSKLLALLRFVTLLQETYGQLVLRLSVWCSTARCQLKYEAAKHYYSSSYWKSVKTALKSFFNWYIRIPINPLCIKLNISAHIFISKINCFMAILLMMDLFETSNWLRLWLSTMIDIFSGDMPCLSLTLLH